MLRNKQTSVTAYALGPGRCAVHSCIGFSLILRAWISYTAVVCLHFPFCRMEAVPTLQVAGRVVEGILYGWYCCLVAFHGLTLPPPFPHHPLTSLFETLTRLSMKHDKLVLAFSLTDSASQWAQVMEPSKMR